MEHRESEGSRLHSLILKFCIKYRFVATYFVTLGKGDEGLHRRLRLTKLLST